MPLVRLVARGGERGTLVLGGSQADVQLLEPRTRRSQGVLAFREAARQARGLGEGLVERCLQPALVIFQQQQFFPRLRGVGLQFHDPLVGGVGMLDQNLVRLTQRATVSRLLRQLAFEVGDLRARGDDLAGELRLVRFQGARRLLRQCQFAANLFARAFQFRRPFFERAVVAAQAVMAGAKLRECVAQADVLGLFLLEGLQRGTDRLDETAESRFQVVERADATVGIDQQIAQRLVVLAYARTDVGQGFADLFGAARAGLGGRRHRIRCGGGSNAFTPKKIGDRTHGMPHNLTQPFVLYRFFQPVTIKTPIGEGESNHTSQDQGLD